MRRALSLVAAVVVMVALAFVVGSARAASMPVFVYAPFAANNAASVSFPDAIDIPLPFAVLDSDEPGPLWHNGALYFTAYRVDSGALNGGWILKWTPDAGAADVRQTSVEAQAETRSVDPVSKYSPARGGLFVGPDGRLYHASFPSTTGRTRVLQIRVVQ